MVKQLSLVLATLATLGFAAAEPSTALRMATSGSESVSALLTGAVLLLVASAARRAPARKE